jgi:hypothetical protein
MSEKKHEASRMDISDKAVADVGGFGYDVPKT